MVKFKTLSCCQKKFYGINVLCANVQYVHTVYAQYQYVSVKAVVPVDFPVYAPSMHHYELQRAITVTELSPSP